MVNSWQGDKLEDPNANEKTKAKKTPKPKNKQKNETTRADEPLHEDDTKPDLTKFTIKKGLNPYGFIHIPKRVRGSLPFEQGVPLRATIKENALVIRRA